MSQDDSRRPDQPGDTAEGIAVIGMSGRFPGASTIEEYWRNLREGVESISFYSREELEAAGIPRDLLDDPTFVPASGGLPGIDRFDAAFFDYSPREAELMDPQFRFLLECSWEALEKAGYDTETYGGSVGVFAGMGMTQYLIHNLLSHPGLLARVGRLQARLVNDKDFLASSVAFRLNLTGPSISVQTACSTSLVAICLASQSLLQFQCDMALAGGVSVAVPQPTGYPAIDGVLSPDGHCRTFDARSRGTVEGSGAGVVVLKRLSDALADGDTIHAVIKGFATNNDGSYKLGFTAPSVDGQMEVVAMAQAVAGVSPETITYVEAHGTGTPMGDPIEVTALTEVFAAGTDKKQFCALGSVKTNVGHLDSAAGVAAFIKTALALEHGLIPPSLHFEQPNPEIDFENSPFFVNTELRPWRTDGFPRRAGVSAFALGGVNAHIVLEEAPEAEPVDPAKPWQLLVLSARTATALDTAADNLARFLEERPELSLEDLADAAYTLQVGRRAMAHRRAVVVRDAGDAVAALRGADPRRLLSGAGALDGARELQVAFLFPGLGNHHAGMARDLYRTEPGFRDRVDDCAERLLPLLGVDLREVIWPAEEGGGEGGLDFRGMLGRGPATEADRRLSRTAMSQPAVFVVEYALAGLWMDWGIAPQAMVGFSVGEYVAACLAGVLSLDDALRLVAGRAKLIDELPGGAMLAVPLSEAAAGAFPELSVAAVCGPELTVLAGPEAAVASVEERLTREGHVCRRLQTTHAFHSAMMEPVLGRFLELFQGITLHEPEIPFLSNVTGTWITAAQATSPAYWAEHLRRTVRFADAVAELWREPGRVLLEVGPGQTLSAWALQHPAAPTGALAVPSLRHSFDRQDDRAFLLGSLARLWLAGLRVDWPLTWSGERRRRVPLPTYPFERQRYWIEAARNAPAPIGLGVDPGPAPEIATVPSRPASPVLLPGGMHPRPELPVPFAAPRDPAEERVSEILREILHLDRVGIHDGFFDIGGDSLLATRLVARLNQAFGSELSLRSVFEMPTAAQLAAAIGERPEDGAGGPPPQIVRRQAGAAPPLSYSQQRLWVLDQLEPGSPFYNVPGVSELLGRVDPAVLARCFAEIVRRHEALRTGFPARDGRPYQVIAEPPAEAWPLPVLDLSALPEDEQRREVERQAGEEAQKPFDLARGPLIRTLLLRRGPEHHVLLLTIHHIVADGWSIGVVTRELAALYDAFAAGRPSPLPELPVQYADFAAWQAEWLQGEVLERETAWWRERLAGSPPFLDLPTDRPRPAMQSFRGARIPLAFPPDLTETLLRRGREAGATLFMTVLAGFAAVLGRAAGQTDVLIGSPVANRRHPDLEGLVGFFVNTLVMRLDLAGAPSWNAFLEGTRETVQNALAHQDLPFEKLVEELQPRRDLSRSPLFQVMLVLQRNPEMAGVEIGAGTVRRLELEPGVSRFDLLIDLEEREGTLLGGLEINTDLFDRTTGQRFAEHLLTLLARAAAGPEVPVSELPLLGEGERQQLLVEWAGTAAGEARPALLHEWVEEQAARTPEAVAVEGEGRSFTYEELNRRADQLAERLRELGVGPEVRVALRAERSPELAVSVLGVLKAGGVCVPLDPAYPAERLAFMRGEAGALVELEGGEAPSPTLPRFAGEGAPALAESESEPSAVSGRADGALSRASARGRVGEGALPPQSLAYLLFTSGSTGRPKGVAMSHGSLSRLIAWQLRSTPGPHRTLQFAPLSFDVSFQELLATWASGGTLVLVSEETRRDPEALWRHLAERSVERLFLPFVALQQLAEAARIRPERPPLSEVITAGETLQVTPAVVELFRRLPGARLHNQYGPTETHVVTAETLTGDPASWPALPPIGRPVDGDRVRVLDPAFQPCPAGVPGELCLGGAGLARGYFGRPDLTAERFVPDPSGAAGERLYRTGDRARFLADGRLEHLGRLDAQVKIRGFRVEPGEVEAVLATHPAVAEAVVAVEGEGPARRLAGWVVPRGEAPSSGELRSFLQERLPDFMIPSGFGFLEALPLTPSGKVDRRALPRLEPSTETVEGFVPPRTEVEEVLAGLWSEVLGISSVGVFDDFFARGGHSLVATQLVSRIRAVLGVDLPLRTVFEAPTVAALAARVEAERRPGTEAPAAPAPAQPAARRSPLLPLSFAQERLWFLDRLDPESAAYDIPSATLMEGTLRPAALEAALAEVVGRHEALRTRFEEIEGVPWQRVLPRVEVRLPLIDLSALPETIRDREARLLAEASTSYRFDLSRAPLFAVLLVRLADDRHHLLAVMHHIIADGWSSSVLLHELSTLYEAALRGEPAPLPPLPLQYTDFALQQRAALAGEALDRLLAGWRARLAGAPESLALPTDRPHPPVQSFRGHSLPVRLEGAATDLGGLARSEGATLFMAILAAFQTLLFRYSNQEDVIVGSPVAGRNRRELESLIGCFINTLPLRTDLSGDPTFRELLGRVREVALEAYSLQELPFEKLVGELHPVRDLARPPLFQTFLILQNTPPARMELPGLSLTPLPLEGQGAKFELLLSLTEERGDLDGYLEHSADLFDRTTAARIARRFATLATAAASQPDVPLSRLDWLPESERQQALVEWNDSAAEEPRFDGLLHRLFEDQARRTPDAVALAAAGRRLTYAELEERTRRLALRLRRLGAGPEVRVGVCLERTPDLVVAILAVLRAGAAYVPMDPAHPAERRGYLVRDARIPVILATPETAAGLPLEGARIVDPRREEKGSGGEAPAGPVDGGRVLPSNLAYLIYTSGSTGQPKGVAITHRNAVALLRWAEGLFDEDEISGLLASTSVGFDLSVFELFVPLTRGGRVILAENALQLPSLPEVAEVTLLNTVPSVLAELLRAGGLPPAVTTVNLAGEALRGALVDDLARSAPNVQRIYNLYGPSEDTTYSTGARIHPGAEREPSIGRPIAGTRAHVLDPRLEPLGIGVPGELGLAGAGLARGYLGRPDLTAERFIPDPTGQEPGGRLYRTGDLARLRPDGEIEYLGRLDHQVKVRGVRIELGEIEAVLALHPGVVQAAVLVVPDETGERRLVAHVARKSGEATAASAAALRSWLQDRLPAAMVPSAFRFHPSLPLTPNGKVDRRALARLGSAGSRTEPRREDREEEQGDPTPLQAWVLRTFTSVLGLEGRTDGDRVRLHDNFFDLGGHSLMATRVLARVRDSLRIDLPLRAVFENPTPARLAAALEAAGRIAAPVAALPAELAGRAGPEDTAAGRPLSFGQRRLWFVDQLEPGSPLYNVAAALRVTGPVRVDVLARCLAEVRRRHEILRTTFASPQDGDGEPVQIVHPAPSRFELTVAELSGLPEGQRQRAAEGLAAREAMRPFDLARGPLWRASLLRLGPTDALFLLTLHHIVSDGWSMGVLIQEVGALYEAFSRGLPSPLRPLPIQYADHAERQIRLLAGETLERELAYWRQQLAGLPPLLELPTDRPRSVLKAGRPFHGGVRPVRISAAATDGLRALAREAGTTLFAALLAGFQALLSRYTGERDLAVGTPVAGRNQLDTEGLIGLFINTLVLRADLSGDPGFRAFLGRVREVTLAAQAHPEVPFERLVEELAPERSLHHTPLFQVLLLLQNVPQEERRVADLTLRPLLLELAGAAGQTAKFDLTLILEERDGGLLGAFKYNADLFDAPTIDRLGGHLEILLVGAGEDPDRRLSGLPLLTLPEARQVVGEWNDTAAAYPAERCLHELIAEQARRTPDAVAVALEGDRLTYGELSRRAERLAEHLRGLGVGPEVPVAICAERSLELVVGLLAILEAGGAYLPLDPEYPRERLAYLLADSGAPVLLVQEGLRDRLPATAARTVLLESGAPSPTLPRSAGEGAPAPPADSGRVSVAEGGGALSHASAWGRVGEGALSPDNLAYVIYTSGSTGNPKGVAVPHRGAVNRILWAQRAYPVTTDDRVFQIASFSFDFSVWELFAPLVAGGTLVLAVPGGHRDAAYLVRAIQEQAVTVVHFVPSMLQLFLEEPGVERCESLRHVLSGGEALTRELESRFFARSASTLWNQYGPTEASIDVTARICLPGEAPERPVPIGRPIANSTTYVLDPDLNPVPAGVLGELYLGGDGIARGYLGRPALTAEKFVPDPWGGPGARLYRTGDRSRWRPDGEVEFLGRLDHQVKVRGVRIELGEVEALLLQHPAVRDAAVVVEDSADQRIAAFVVESEGRLGFGDPAAQELALADLRSFVRERLPAYMVPGAWTVLEALPLTPAGKVDRRALTRLAAEQGPAFAAFEAPRTSAEVLVAGVWSELLQREKVGVRDDFFALGGHSLLATRVVSRLRALFQVELPLRALFEAPTLEGLAARVEQERAARGMEGGAPPPPPITPVPREPQGLPLSFAQERLWFIDQLEPGSPLYNIPVALRVTGPLDAGLLARCLGEIERRHEVLRTVFPATDGPPLQKAMPAEERTAEGRPFPLEVEDLSAQEHPERAALARIAAEVARPFDLAHGPVWRAFLWKLADGEHLALLTLHHIASDGWSMGLLVREMAALYGAWTIPSPEDARAASSGRPGDEPSASVVGAQFIAPAAVRTENRTVLAGGTDAGAMNRTVLAGGTDGGAMNRTVPTGGTDGGAMNRTVLTGGTDADAMNRTVPTGGTGGGAMNRTVLTGGTDAGAMNCAPTTDAERRTEEERWSRAAAASGASPLPPLPVQYADYAVWQRRWLQGEVLARELAYWRERLAGAPAVLELPADRPRPPAQSYRGAFLPVRLSREVSERLLAFSRGQGATPFMVLLAAFQALLGRLSGQTDLTVGSPVAGRGRVEVENLVGFFVNTLVLRGDLSGDPAFRVLAQRAREEALGAQGHQEVPFEKLVEELAPERSLGHSPLFQAMLSLQNTPREPLVLPGLTLAPLEAHEAVVPVAKLDLTLTLTEVGDAFAGSLEYATDLFDEATADRFAGCFLRLLAGALEDPETRLSDLPLLTPEELRQLAFEDGGAIIAPAPRLACDLFETWVDRTPEAVAAVLDAESWTYAELEAQANRLAHRLAALGVRPEDVVAVGLERSLDAVAALLAVWKAGGVYLPLDPAYPEARRAWLLADSGARVLVGRRSLLGGLAIPATILLDEDDLASEPATRPVSPADPDNLAYLIYTSGSTGEPKAVAVAHAPAAAHFAGVAAAYGLGPGERMLLFAALSFDVSLEQIGAALGSGAALVMRGEELWSPSELSQRLLGHGVTVVNLPTAYWAQWARELATSETPAVLLRWTVPGGEALTPEAARLWLENPDTAFLPLLNAYGPTEAVMTATHFLVRPGSFAPSASAVPVGKPLPYRRAYVLDRLGHPQPAGVPGELCLGGLLARGYLNRPALSAERFVPDPFAVFHEEAGARLYRTGDLARRLPSGDLEFLGRADHQVKVRGFRIELGEIEAALARHPQVLESAVLLLEGRLAAYVASRVPAEELAATLREHLSGLLPAPLVPSAFVVLPALPLTATGKIDRRALPAPGPAEGVSTPGYTAPRNPFEEVLAALWSEVLGVEPVGIHDNFFELGGHSLLATQLASRLRRAFRVEMPLRDLFEAPTVASLAVRIERLTRAGEGPAAPPIRPLPAQAREAGLPLSFAQQRLWLVDHLEPGNTAYNIPFAVRLDGPLRPELLERTFSEILGRHEALRTRFSLRGGEPVQVIPPPAPMPLPRIDLEGIPADARWAEAQRLAAEQANRPFDLATGPLFRASLIRLEPDVHALISAMHHIVSDEWSARLMFQEVVTLYGGLREGRDPSKLPLPELPVQYADYAVWQRQWLSGDVLEKQLVYWRERLGGDLPVLELPTDRPRPAVQTYRGGRLRFPLAGPADRAVRALARREGASLFMTLLAAFYALLRHLTGQTDLCVGTPITGRTRVEVENLIGFFLNTLVLRADLDDRRGDPTFRALLRQVRELSLQGYANQDVPFEKLVDELKPKRSLSHSPLFQAMFVLLQTDVPTANSFDLKLSPFTPGLAAAKFDLTLSIMAEGEQAWALLEYNSDLFDGTTARRWAGHFESLVAAVAAEPDRPLTELPLLSAAEVHQLSREQDDRPALPGQDLPVHERFRRQAALTPERPAVIWAEGGWSYAELDGRAAHLAAVLRRAGVGPDDRVGVCAERGPELAAALLATLKAGGAYVPLDPAYPRERLAYMLADAGVKVLLLQEALAPLLPDPESRLLFLDGAEGVWAAGWEIPETPEPLETPVDLGHLCYLIYTSGSTGRPKGTALPHSTLANLIGWQLSTLAEGEAAPRTLQYVSPSFDVSLQEVFATWCAGGTLVLAAEDVRRDPERLIRFLAEERIERLFLPYVALQQIAEQAAGPVPVPLPASLREIVTAGERLQITPQIAALCEGIPGFREQGALRNQYGPSESHVVTEYVLTGGPAGWPPLPPIGRPIPGTAAHVLDRSLRPVPLGVAGELALGGVCLARGYLNRPDLTAERFLPDGFSGRAGERIYRTGDLVRRLPSGDIEFLGRIDHQVKVRGFRIEPGEIEVVLASHPRVLESAVVVREDGSGDRRLVAYVAAEGGVALDSVELRDFLRERLPAYMVPAAFVSLPALPLTSSGKVDRAALPAPEGAGGSGVDYVEPKSGLERTIATVIGEVLGVARVGIEDNFFDLGVHSLLMVRAANGLSERLGRKVQVLEMFRFPTVASLAQHLSQEEDEAPSKEQFEQRAEARRQGMRRRDRRGRAGRNAAAGEAEEPQDEPAEVAD